MFTVKEWKKKKIETWSQQYLDVGGVLATSLCLLWEIDDSLKFRIKSVKKYDKIEVVPSMINFL